MLDSSKEFIDNQATTECTFFLKHVYDMIRTYSNIFIFSFIINIFLAPLFKTLLSPEHYLGLLIIVNTSKKYYH